MGERERDQGGSPQMRPEATRQLYGPRLCGRSNTTMEMTAAEDAVGSARGKFLAGRGRREREGRRFAAVDDASGRKATERKGVAVAPLRIHVADEAARRK